MRILLKSILLAAVLMFCGNVVSAQKLGVINLQELIMAMPERDSADVKLRKFGEELAAQLEVIQVEYNNKALEYQKAQATLTDTEKQMRERSLQELGRRYEEFNQTAQQDYQKMQQELMAPIFSSAEEAIKKVSKAQGLTMSFDTSSGAMIYRDEATVVDLLPLVKRELGINN